MPIQYTDCSGPGKIEKQKLLKNINIVLEFAQNLKFVGTRYNHLSKAVLEAVLMSKGKI